MVCHLKFKVASYCSLLLYIQDWGKNDYDIQDVEYVIDMWESIGEHYTDVFFDDNDVQEFLIYILKNTR